MLIQNIGGTVTASGFTGSNGSVPVATPGIQAAPVAPPQSTALPATQPTATQLKAAVDGINHVMQQNNSNVEFSIDQSTKQTVIKVVDSQSGQLITQFPSKEALAVSQMLEQSQQGALLKQKA